MVAFAQANGFAVTSTSANRLVVALSGTAGAINNAFHVRMSLYQMPTGPRTFYSPDREPSLALSVPIAHISGLNNFSMPKPLVARAQVGQATGDPAGSGPSGSYVASDMRAAYYGGTQLTGVGQAVGLVEWGGYYLSDVDLAFSSVNQSYSVPINNVLLDGAIAVPAENGDDAEQVLDIVQAIGMAPGLSQVRVYIGNGNDDANLLNKMASENIAKNLSCSWSWLPDDPGTDDVFFKEMAAQGQSFFAASGDEGAYDAQISPYFYPAEDDYVTAVGGTHLVTETPGGPWSSETAWNSYGAGSGGGVSPDGILLPSWQIGLATLANGGSTKYRNVPDVAMEADFDNYNCDIGQCGTGWAGTSFAAPRWAAFAALVNQQAVESGTAPKGGIGFLNPALYSIGKGSNALADFHDIVSGNNLTLYQPTWFNAETGYDLVTGWGSPTGQDLINDLAGKQGPGFWLEASSPTIEMNPGGSGSTTISIAGAGGFTGSVQLAITSTLPSGVTAKWGTNPTSVSSLLTLTAASTVANVTTPVTIKGTSGSITQTTQITLTVHTPSFSLSTMPGSVGVSPGNSVPATVVVNPLYGFKGSVKLAVSGLPAGVTAKLATNPTTGTSILTLSAASTAASGTSTLTITGTSGSITATTTLVLTVHLPTFSLYGPTSVNLGPGTSGSGNFWVFGQYGFSGAVNLAVTGLPSGVTASFSPNPTTNYSILTLTASSAAALGTHTLTVTGTSGSLKATTTFKLNILAPTFTILTSNVGIGRGTSTTSQIWVIPEYGFSGSVNLALSGLPSGVTASMNPNPATGASVLSLSASSTAPLGTSTVTITGTSGTLKGTSSFTLGVFIPTFALSTGGPVSLGQGSKATTAVIVNPEYGFTGTVSLGLTGLPTGVTASVTPNPVTGTAQLTLTASSTAAVGKSTVTITGTSGSQTAKTALPLSIFAPSFTVAASGQVNLGVGSTATTTATVTPQYGFLGSVSLALSGLPSGVTASFSPNPTTGSSIVVLTSSSTTAAGNYTVTLTGASGTRSAKTIFPLTIAAPAFTITSPGEVDLGAGTSTVAYPTVNPENGFTGSVQMAISGLPSGVTASFNPSRVTGSTALTLTAASTAAAGSSTVTITGTSGAKTAKTTFPLKVAAPTFTIAPIGSISLIQGQVTTANVSVNSLYGFTGSVNLTASGLPAGVTAFFAPNPTNQGGTLTLTAASTATVGTTTVTVKGTWGSKTSSTTFPLMVAAPNFTLGGPGQMLLAPGGTTTGQITVFPETGFTGSVTLAISGLPSGVTASLSPNPTSGSSTLKLSAASTAAQGTTTVTVTGSSGKSTATLKIPVQVQAPEFTLSGPSQLTISPGGTASGSVYVNAVYGFAGMVKLVASGLPAGVTATFSPNPVSGGYATLFLTATSTVAVGSKTVTITGTSGSLTATTTFPLSVATPTFTLSAPTVTVNPGTVATASVYINWQNGVGGNVNLSVSGLPGGVTGSFAPVSTNSQSTLTLTAASTASRGQYNAVIKGTYGNQTATTLLNITVEPPSFSLTADQPLQLGRGTSAGAPVNISPQNGFNGTVHLSAAGLPAGVTATFSPNPASQNSTITLTASSTAALGQYNATVTGTSGSETETAPISVTIFAPSFTLNGSGPVSLNLGSSAQANVWISAQNGFTGSVNFSVSGLPSGVTGSFLPTPATDQTVLTLVGGSSAALGQYNITVTGVSGSQTAKTMIPLIISGNSFTLWSSGLSVGQGTSASTFVNVNATTALSYPVQLTASGLPSGVTASFSPNPTTGNSGLTLTATKTASVGEFNVTLTGVGGGQKATTQIPVTVAVPSFTVSGPYQPSLAQGGSYTSTVWISPQYGFNGAVKLSLSGLPSGVTASFTPNPATSQSTMTLMATSAVTPGQYNVTLIGTSGTQTAKSPFTLSIGAPSFTISDNGGVSLGQGTSTTTNVYVSSSFGFVNAVTLSISGLPTGVTGSFSPNPTTGQSTLTLTATSAAGAGIYQATIRGTSGKTTATTPLSITVGAPSFYLNCYGPVQVGQGSSGTAYVYVNSNFGFSGSVQLKASGLPSGVTASFSPNSTTYSSLMTLSATNAVAPGQYNFVIKGTSGTLAASTPVTLVVYPPTFSIYAGPFNIGQGTTATSNVSVNSQYGFAGSVHLAISGLPSGVTALFAPNPTWSTSTLTLTASATAALGQYNVIITGTYGKQTASTSTTVTVYAPTFTISGPYNDVSVGRGASTQSYVNVNPLYGFTGSVHLAVTGLPTGVAASFSPNPTANSSVLTLTASSTATLGQYTATLTGTSGSQRVTTQFAVAVYAPAFTLSSGNSVNLGQGTTATNWVSVNSQYGFTGSVKLALSGLPSGVTASFSANPTNSSTTLTLTASGTAPTGFYTVSVKGTSGTQTAATTFTLGVFVPEFTIDAGTGLSMGQGATGTTYVSVNSEYGFSGSVKLAVSGLPSGVTASFSPNPTNSSSTMLLTASGTAPTGSYTVTVTGTSGTRTAAATFTLGIYTPTFTLNGPNQVTIGRGTSATSYVSISPLYGFTGNVKLAVSGLPSGVTASFSPNPATSTGSTLTLTASGTVPIGQYQVTLTGTSGSQVFSAPFSLSVYAPTFTLYAGSVNMGQGTTGTTNVSVNSQYGFTGSVKLAVSGLPSGVTASFSPNPTTGNSTLSLTASGTAPFGSYTATVTGTSGTQSASTTFTLSIYTPTFTLFTQNVSLGQGTTATTSVSINFQYGFSGTVKLAASGLPSGVTASFSPNPANSSSTMTLTATGTAPAGLYQATVTGTSGTQAASTNFTLGIYPPTFTVSVWSGVSLGQGTSGTAYVSVNSEYGFSGSIKLAASGLPSGVTASFSPNPETGNGGSSLKLTASGAASLGQYTVTVQGTSGTQSAFTTFTLSVYMPTFEVYAGSNVSIGQGTTTTTTVAVNPEYGFTGTVKLALTGLPAGVTASFSPNPATGNSTLTLKASSTASLGLYTVTITGTSGSQTASSTFTLGVYVPTFTLSDWYIPTLGAGGSVQSTVYINDEYGFAGIVQLTVTGLPSGVTASFSPNPATSNSTLTLKAGTTVKAGQYPLTITGTSGSQKASASVLLTIN